MERPLMNDNFAEPPWAIRPLPNNRLRWNRQCPHCHVTLLTNETPGFCCGRNGSRLGDVVPLPPLPAEYNAFINSPDISPASRILNLIFSFAALESTAEFPATRGPPGFFAVQGRIYHRLRPNHQNSGIRWLSHDGYMRDRAPFPQWIDSIPPSWTTAMANALLRINPLARHLQHLHLLLPVHFPNAQIDLRDEGTAEIAAIMVYDNTALGDVAPRTLVISRRDGAERSVPTTSRFWEPLAYPLLFPHGTLGWGVVGENGDLRRELEVLDDNIDAPTSLIWHTRARLLREPRFEMFGRLTCEYVVDQWTREIDCRLNYIAANQARIRQQDAELMGEERVPDSENIFLPASFLGSRRWCSERAAEALAVAASLGVPTFFITFTCSTDWPEITERLRGGQTFTDIPVVVARVFKQKLAQLLAILENLFPNAGKPVYIMHSVEFQKRGLPHAHILVKYNLECVTAEDIDTVISAELPDDPTDRELVRKLMLHKHPRPEQPPSTYCQRENDAGMRSCRFGYPKALQAVTTVDNEGRVQYRRRNPGDEIVVPYCLTLLKRFRCHINFECANTSTIFQYLFKYIHKGPDRARFRVGVGPDAEPINEIEDFVAGRYLSAGEATWRILGFHITRKQPAVSTLPIHLPLTNHHHQYHRRDGLQSSMSQLDRYLCRPRGQFVRNGTPFLFADLSYTEYYRFFRLLKYNPTHLQCPGHFVEHETPEGEIVMMVVQRTLSNDHIARIQPVPPSQGERFYLRSILVHRPVTSYLDARTVDGRLYDTFQEAAAALGIFADQNEAEYAMEEAVTSARPPASLRFLFVHLLVNDCCPTPRAIWDVFKPHLILDYYIQNNMVEDLATDLALHDIGRYLEEYHKTLADYGLPNPVHRVPEVLYELRRWGPLVPLMQGRAEEAERSFNPEQRAVYHEVVAAAIQRQPLLLFVDGKAGRGKTFLVNAICDRLRGMGRIVVATATSASAAQLYPGGRTAHSAFKIPVNDRSELLESPIEPGSPAAELLAEASVLIWDEAPMANKAALACMENLLRLIMQRPDVPFGGKILILLGDFRQTCPVIRHGSRAQVVEASIRSSHLWPLFQIRRLVTPIRNAADLEYAAFVDAIGDGAGPEVELDLLPTTNEMGGIVDFVYPPEVLAAPEACLTRSILAPTHVQVNAYNTDIKDRLEGMDRTYFAADSLKEADDLDLEPDQAILDFVARHTPPGLPDAQLVLRKGAVVRLMRNFSIERGLVNNMRGVVADVGNRLVTIHRLVATGGVNRIGEELLLIPRIIFSHPLPSGHTLQRKQFPLALGYATTFNSCQGLTLDRMGIDLTKPVFSHGQLYTALSRIKLRGHGLGLLPLGQSRVLNVTYPEILI